MRSTRLLLATLKETPSDAETISHQLMLRAGMIRKVAAGIYNWLPLGLRVLRKVEKIVREEMDRAGAQELIMPAVQPAELWQESGRWNDYGPELLRFKDRHDREFCLGPTHEEVITALIRNEVKSYRQLPANFYQIQTKFRDEIRPRFGVMRAREFVMKDAYSFHADMSSLQETYQVMFDTYSRIFTRIGLKFRAVEADTGAIGGSASHEFHVLADSGEDAIALCDQFNYAANVELAPALAPDQERAAPDAELAVVDTPGAGTVAEVATLLASSPDRIAKTLLVHGKPGPVALVLRGDHELNAVKAAKLPEVAAPLTMLRPDEVRALLGCDVGSIGPRGLPFPVIADHAVAVLSDFVCGANQTGRHLTGVNWGRDLAEPETADLRKVVDGDPCPTAGDRRDDPGAALNIRRGIEVGHIFQLGTKYSKAMGATCLDEQGNALTMPMGCYGIGVSRVVAAAIEQNHDDNGIVWPAAISPFEVILIPIGSKKSPQVAKTADTIYNNLLEAGFEVLLDDRDERPGVMFAEADLIGITHRLVIGERGLKRGIVEYKGRSDASPQDLPLDGLIETLSVLKTAK